ncbi:MAG: phosphatidate phosphatase App1 family protein [Pirellulaceae bacterium]
MPTVLNGLVTTGVTWLSLLGFGCSQNQDAAAPDVPDGSAVTVTASDISADEEVVFFPTAAHFDAASSHWIVPIHGCIYEPAQDSQNRGVVVAAMRRAAGVEEGSPEAQRLDQRVRLFLVDNERGQKISIRLGAELYEVGTSEPNGHFQTDLRIPATRIEELRSRPESLDGFVSFSAVTRDTDARSFTGRVQMVPSQGLSIISDIDDTIKHTQVGDRRAVLANTFWHEFQPVPGMSELYRQWAQQGIVFHYVSGSPWQLYLPLAEFFRTQQFPEGSMDLKLFRLKDPSALDLLQSQTATKIRAIEPLLTAFPQRRFVLIGDSGEQDPEIYTELARTHRPQIVGVFIRNVTAEQLDGARCRALQPGLAGVRFQLFEQADELRPIMAEISL